MFCQVLIILIAPAMKSTRQFLFRSLLAAALMSAFGAHAGDSAPPVPQAQLIGRFADGVSAGTAEIVAFHAASRSAFITVDRRNQPSSFQRISLRGLSSSALANPVQASNLTSGAITSVASHVNGNGFSAGGVQSLDIAGDLLAIAVQASPKTDPGLVAFYRLDAQGNASFLKKVNVGSLPDGLKFSPDGSQLVVANEGELSATFATDGIDPVGSISIIAVKQGMPADQAVTLDFSDFNAGAKRSIELPAAVRIGRIGASVAQDMEPEYVSISADSSRAYVTLQENNAVAVVNLRQPHIERLLPMGVKDHGLARNALAASDQVEPPFKLKSYRQLFGLYMPDGIATFRVNGSEYFITANEGDDRDDFQNPGETARVRSLALDAAAFPDAAALQANHELGRLNVFNTMGRNSQGQYEKLHTLGGRSFSIHDARTGAQVYESGSELESLAYSRLDARLLGHAQVKGRLDNKGPEPESVVVGQVGSRLYAFVGLERASAIAIYDVSKPTAPRFVQWLQNSTDLTHGDLSPEGLAFVPAAHSPTGNALLLAGYEVSGSLAVYEIK